MERRVKMDTFPLESGVFNVPDNPKSMLHPVSNNSFPAEEKKIYGSLTLRRSTEADLVTFFRNQADVEACHMAAFTGKDPSDKAAYLAKWIPILSNPTVNMQTILPEGIIVGSVLSYEMEGDPQVSYWIGKEFWGQGIATHALNLFLDQATKRPIYGRAAKDNLASIKVLEKCGFEFEAFEMGYANARGKEIEEVVYIRRK